MNNRVLIGEKLRRSRSRFMRDALGISLAGPTRHWTIHKMALADQRWCEALGKGLLDDPWS